MVSTYMRDIYETPMILKKRKPYLDSAFGMDFLKSNFIVKLANIQCIQSALGFGGRFP